MTQNVYKFMALASMLKTSSQLASYIKHSYISQRRQESTVECLPVIIPPFLIIIHREENRACRTSRRGSSCVPGSWRTKLFLWQAEQGSRRTRRHLRVSRQSSRGSRLGCPCRFRIGVVECQLIAHEWPVIENLPLQSLSN